MFDPSLLSHTEPHLEEQDWNVRKLSTIVQNPDRRLWIYDKPAVVLGGSQRGLVSNEDSLRRAGIDVVERQAGGGAVLVGPWMLSASIALPTSHPLVTASTAKSYQWLGDVYASVLGNLGVSAHVLTPEDAAEWQRSTASSSLGWACFGGLSPGEVVVGRRKIVGFAQVRRRNGILLVAGLLLANPDWELLCSVMGKPMQDAELLTQCTTSCAEQLGHGLSLKEIANPLERTLEEALGRHCIENNKAGDKHDDARIF